MISEIIIFCNFYDYYHFWNYSSIVSGSSESLLNHGWDNAQVGLYLLLGLISVSLRNRLNYVLEINWGGITHLSFSCIDHASPINILLYHNPSYSMDDNQQVIDTLSHPQPIYRLLCYIFYYSIIQVPYMLMFHTISSSMMNMCILQHLCL